MRLIDADAMKAEWKMGDFCEECKRDARQCAIDYCFTRMDVCGMIDDAPTVNGWTSVKDGLPKKNGKYIVISDSPICRRILIASFAKNLETVDECAFPLRGKKRPGWYDYDCDWGYFELDYVTHWLPLPEMPEGE